MPYAADAMAHLLFYHEHINKVHHQHGTLHAHLESVDTSKKLNSPDTAAPVSKQENNCSEHILTLAAYHFFTTTSHNNPLLTVPPFYSNIKPGADSPPPEIS